MLGSILASNGAAITVAEIIICIAASLILGFVISLVFMYRNTYTKNFAITLALLPVMVQTVIMLVNGNLGTGVAIAGAFGLVRFRSAPGNAREISGIFFAMVVGLATGMGYIAYAVLFTIVISIVMMAYTALNFGEKSTNVKLLKIVIPEDMDYAHAFDEPLKEYTSHSSLDRVRTTNLGGLFELQYTIILKDINKEKEFIDEIRVRNGNLNIVCGKVVSASNEL